MFQQHPNSDEEQRFLFGSKKFRCYGSIDDLNSPSTSTPKVAQIISHQVQPTDTLHGLEIRYNTSMFEIKRLNKLWSNQSLYCKTQVLIPIFEDNSRSVSSSAPSGLSSSSSASCGVHLNRMEEEKTRDKREEESLDQMLKRIDRSMKKTKKTVKRLYQGGFSQQKDAD